MTNTEIIEERVKKYNKLLIEAQNELETGYENNLIECITMFTTNKKMRKIYEDNSAEDIKTALKEIINSPKFVALMSKCLSDNKEIQALCNKANATVSEKHPQSSNDESDPTTAFDITVMDNGNVPDTYY